VRRVVILTSAKDRNSKTVDDVMVEMPRRGNVAAPKRDKVTVRAELANDALNVGFFFGMSLSMSEPNAEEHECSAHDLWQREWFAEQNCRHGRGQWSLG
jgi:hypothetical protein